MIKLKSLLKEEMTSLGSMKVPIQLVDLYFNLEQCPKGNIYAYAQNQTRLYKALSRFGEEPVAKTLLNKINNVYGEYGHYRLTQPITDPAKPIMFLFIPND